LLFECTLMITGKEITWFVDKVDIKLNGIWVTTTVIRLAMHVQRAWYMNGYRNVTTVPQCVSKL